MRLDGGGAVGREQPLGVLGDIQWVEVPTGLTWADDHAGYLPSGLVGVVGSADETPSGIAWFRPAR